MASPDFMKQAVQSEETIFSAALLCGSTAARAAYLDQACADNFELRRSVEELLQASDAAGTLFDHIPVVQVQQHSPASENNPVEVSRSAVIEEGPGTQVGRYRLLEKLGEGGFGEVFVAEQREPVRRKVALKIIKLGMDTRQVIARFEAERQALALMDHPNIAKVLDAGATGAGRPYFVMELVRGQAITQFCDKNQLTAEERLKLFIHVCQAIQHAHQKGIIHRDIKPSNILVTLHDGVPVPKVIDFGIAKATQGDLTDKTIHTQFQQFIGTPAYVSPEQAEMSGLDIDTRSDIYALGVLLYELLVGRTPFDAREMLRAGLDSMRQTIREQEPIRPSTRLSSLEGLERTSVAKSRGGVDVAKLVSAVRGDVDWIVMKCLEKDRCRRYETAVGLSADIQRHLSNEPVLARPASALYRFQKAFCRNRLAFAAGGAVALSLLTGLIVAVVSWSRADLAYQGALAARAAEESERVRAQTALKAAESEKLRADAQARKASTSEEQSRRLLYAADLNLAQRALEQNNLGRARRLLDRHRPKVGETDLRGWEWRYLWQLTRSDAVWSLTNRPVRGSDVSLSPSGTWLAVGWYDGRLDLWDVPARRWVRALTDREQSHQGHVAFGPAGNLLAATSEAGAITVYDFDTGRASVVWTPPARGRWSVRDLSFSQDGSRLVVSAGTIPVSEDAVWVVKIPSGDVEGTIATTFGNTFVHGAARISPDNQRVYLAYSEPSQFRYLIQCVEIQSGRELWRTRWERDLGLTAMTLSPDGGVVVSGSGFEDPAIRVWDAATGRFLVRLDGHSSWVSKLAFSNDGKTLISASSDQSIRYWSTDRWTEYRVLRGHTDEIHAVAVSGPGRLAASTSKNGDLLLWQVDESVNADGYFRLPESLDVGQVHPVDKSLLLVSSPGGSAGLLDLGYPNGPFAVLEFGNAGEFLGRLSSNLVCYWNGTDKVVVSELRGGSLFQRESIALRAGLRPTGFASHPTGHEMAWGMGEGSSSVQVVNFKEPARRVELAGNVPGIRPFAFSEDGQFLGAKTSAWNSRLRVWKVRTGEVVLAVDGVVRDAVFAAGGRVMVVSVSLEPGLQTTFYDLLHPEREPRRYTWRDDGGSLAVSPDGELVALSTYGGQVRLFDISRDEWVGDFHGHLNGVHSLAFSSDGRRLISATSGGRESIKVWDVGTWQELLTLKGTGSLLKEARWSVNGDIILTGPPWQAWRAPSWEEISAAEGAGQPTRTPP